jgi:hypothetical protein
MAEATTATPMADRARQEMEQLVEQGGNLTPEQQRQILQYAAGALLSSILLKVVFNAMFYLYIVALPLVYLYCVQTCPSNESFDAKKEIKRVLRGYVVNYVSRLLSYCVVSLSVYCFILMLIEIWFHAYYYSVAVTICPRITQTNQR